MPNHDGAGKLKTNGMSATLGQNEPYGRPNIANSKFAGRGIKGCRIFKLWGDPSRKLGEGERGNYRVQASRLASLKSIGPLQPRAH